MGATATASVRRAAEKSTLELPFRIPAKEWFSLREAASICGMGETFVETLFNAASDQRRGELFGHEHNAGKGARMTKRIPRIFLVAYLIKTATYDNDALVDCLVGCLQTCSRTQQARVYQSLGRWLQLHT